ncbi:Cytochrome P450 4C1 [Armadillidium nasatum]|uniref:Cytochrome P450 4C1 n=1 Tax=Armadillidium nasatum TaxID=96803 RepID=A0A5N5THQ6_9CRUS|nr:Cytochrome P450 4C1 [Armadillidium nasatum]
MENTKEIISLFNVLITFCICYFLYFFINHRRKFISNNYSVLKLTFQKVILDKIPGPKPLPILGNALEFSGSPVDNFKAGLRVSQNECGLTRVWIGFKPHCAIYKASGTEVLLSSNKYLDKSADYKALHPWLGTGLLTSTGTKWHHRRKILTPAFHFKILEDFVDIFNQQSQIFVQKLNSKCDGKPFDIFPYITLCTLDIILGMEMCNIVFEKQSRPWLQIGIIYSLLGYAKRQEKCLKILHGFSYETIRERKKKRIELKLSGENKKKNNDEVLGKKKRLAFLDMLLEYAEEHETLSDEDIREEVDTFMFEGHDTTAAAINWALYLLGQNPEIQNKAYEEIESIFGKSEREATSSDLREMKYLECCIKEALRLFPSVPLFGRELKEDIKIGEYVIPKGTSVMISTYRLHRDSEVFPDPEAFKPERFFPENSVNRNPYAYIPFSAGPRNCIGQKFALMEEKVILSTFLRNFRVESTQNVQDLNLVGELILRPEKETLVKIYSRN